MRPGERQLPLRLMTLGSGSSGNASLLTYGKTTILIDAGLPYRKLLGLLDELHVPTHSIKAIFITHDHADHIRSAVKLAVNHFIPLYCSHKVAYRLVSHRYARPALSAFVRHIMPGGEGAVVVGDMRVEAFSVPHDATDNLGFTVSTPAGVFSIITDIGRVTEDIERAILRSHFLIFESNYDTDMLWQGAYPLYLKERITSGTGHLSNREAAETIQRCYHRGLKFVALCHLSQDNNRPHLAYNEMAHSLQAIGLDLRRDIYLQVLPRYDVTCYLLHREMEQIEAPLWTLIEE